MTSGNHCSHAVCVYALGCVAGKKAAGRTGAAALPFLLLLLGKIKKRKLAFRHLNSVVDPFRKQVLSLPPLGRLSPEYLRLEMCSANTIGVHCSIKNVSLLRKESAARLIYT